MQLFIEFSFEIQKNYIFEKVNIDESKKQNSI